MSGHHLEVYLGHHTRWLEGECAEEERTKCMRRKRRRLKRGEEEGEEKEEEEEGEEGEGRKS